MRNIKKFLRVFDIYGHAVSFNYKGEGTKKTLPGSLLTLATMGVLIYHFSSQLNVINLKKSQINQAQYPINTQTKTIDIHQPNFDLAFLIDIDKDASESIFKYMNITASFNSLGLTLDEETDRLEGVNISISQNIELQNCSMERMGNNSLFHSYIKTFTNKQFLCIKKLPDMELRGSNNIIQLKIRDCNQTQLKQMKDKGIYYPSETCYEKEVNKTAIPWIDKASIYAFTLQQFFDFEEINDDPIKLNLNVDKYAFSEVNMNEVAYEIQLSKVSGSKSRIHESIGEFENDFLSTKMKYIKSAPRSSQEAVSNSSKPFFNFRFQMSNEVNTISFTTQNMVQALSNTGGLAGILIGVIAFIIAPLQEFLYYKSLLRKTYLVEKSILDQHKSNQNDPNNQKIAAQDELIESNLKEKLKQNEITTLGKLINLLWDRVPFTYTLTEFLVYWGRRVFCCRKSSFRKELFDLGKDKIEKQLDIGKILKDLRNFKMINNILLSRKQRQLIPYSKDYLLTQKYKKQQDSKDKQGVKIEDLNQSQNDIHISFKEDLSKTLIYHFLYWHNPENKLDLKIQKRIFFSSKNKLMQMLDKQRMAFVMKLIKGINSERDLNNSQCLSEQAFPLGKSPVNESKNKVEDALIEILEEKQNSHSSQLNVKQANFDVDFIDSQRSVDYDELDEKQTSIRKDFNYLKQNDRNISQGNAGKK
ncbi:UNKNOWN [Stylonychia lemnae]|uniref:Transmembrane protein n=1 Tax=Stylonychia lemnae TaxID=5949 RepID=A0A078ALK8_STYLE|nr:UNKNOWN [Stylonychia lemnae]|eukprot:CDW82292.1 UNKNOWN [Stylonychia lemnae]